MVIVETFLLTNGNITACKKESVRVLVFVCLNSVLSWFILTNNIWLQCGEKSISLLIPRKVKQIYLKLKTYSQVGYSE